MANDPKPTPSWHSRKYYHRHTEATAPLPAEPPLAHMPKKPVHQRLLDFVEQPLFTLPIGIIGGLVGVFFYAPVLTVCGLCVFLAFHRAKVVAGESLWRVQVPVYAVLCTIVVSGLYGLHVVIRNQLAEANISLSHSLGDYLKQTFGKPPHTHVSFLTFSTPNLRSQVPFYEGQSVRLNMRYWNSGDFAIESSKFGGIIRVFPMKASAHEVWDDLNEQIKLEYIGSAMPATHQENDYEYRTIVSNKPLTKDEADGLMAYPATKQLCLLGRMHWQDATGRYETLHFLCLHHESASNADFSIGIGEQHNSEQVLSQ
jgi:hypothetical protein